MARSRIYPPSVDPGIPNLGDAPPPGWRRTTFGAILDVVKRPVSLDADKTYRLVVAKRNRGGIELRRETRGADVKTPTQFSIASGDFLISRRQIIHGACGVVPESLDGAVVSNEYSTLRTKDGLDMAYLRYFSSAPYFRRTTFHSSHGVDVEKMIFKIDDWLDREVDVPPLAEQRKIAAILSSVDEAIQRTQAVIDQVQGVKKALMQELLTRGLPGRHTRFKQTEIGKIPESWDVVQIDDLLSSCVYGVNARLSTDSKAGLPVLRMGNIQDHRLDLDDLKFADLSNLDQEKIRLRRGDVLFNRTNSFDLVGKVAYVDTDQPLSYASYLLRLRAQEGRAHAQWLHIAMSSDAFQDRLRAIATRGVSQSNINPTKMRKLKLGVPPLPEQEELVDAVASVETRRTREVESLSALRLLKDSVAAVLLSGEVRVQTNDSEAAA